MVSLFPQLFDYGFLATGVFRITLGLILVRLAYQSFSAKRNERLLTLEKEGIKPAFLFLSLVSGIEMILGILFVIGLFTQVAALAVSIFALICIFVKRQKPSLFILSNTNDFYLLLLVVSLVLAFIGPGALAIDLPL